MGVEFLHIRVSIFTNGGKRTYSFCNEWVYDGFFYRRSSMFCDQWVLKLQSIRGSIFSNKIRGLPYFVNYLDKGYSNIKNNKS